MYGIPNRDTIRKARAWLDAQGIKCEFHDYKKAGIDAVAGGDKSVVTATHLTYL
ncbi:MAG: hypothetical protein QM718_00635 [Steroidobacteraceae bacterium]